MKGKFKTGRYHFVENILGTFQPNIRVRAANLKCGPCTANCLFELEKGKPFTTLFAYDQSVRFDDILTNNFKDRFYAIMVSMTDNYIQQKFFKGNIAQQT